MKTERIPIDEFGDGNCCPVCGSVKISRNLQFPLYVEEDLQTGKQIIRDDSGKRIYKPSDRLLARLYRASQMDAQMWVFSCRKCGWLSDSIVT